MQNTLHCAVLPERAPKISCPEFHYYLCMHNIAPTISGCSRRSARDARVWRHASSHDWLHADLHGSQVRKANADSGRIEEHEICKWKTSMPQERMQGTRREGEGGKGRERERRNDEERQRMTMEGKTRDGKNTRERKTKRGN